ncbi:bifunctional methylenetetrahydrofolate dehydrogenase/methenyltetrahydrofolate cyclohydrolase FolD [Lacticaseibacillus rhamnosus]|uniref:bifunctional methylenetetrahydrofolate dehydrogenase/methenyltetrahydrofolate cyclohydrolase FolD n=1 Tax=Lacticaseibacillus rhamnosus TaxID=47715 RepID=UPI0008A5EE4A|nr:bifunctional methylenetetrahydrofolate dehydrogenase/methenyltetrahydrofolate cyclohydrolase FolD [Lacticaseibacillus rhamnosus]MDK7182481.1 bifunctional methylenetetrahydrofolate dehydrogenase/methenyltetrahydrofolate cyclohydrolase FolD [Lacticaseibacillus rhamnosus]MDK7239082.1 bifunctional methylenetetrahydrofolate dehydrogenase/methenyltetrahydrofolate cyclohydrolase FolD [Lacticaseibacillus rhamnosus]MDT8865569.1 bifunctional methylenetetrahydrofolate dehydrogenase/methenyltetrahydrofol
MATRLDGRVVSKKILGELKQTVAKLAQQDVTPTLAVVLVGSDPASEVYVRNKQRRAEEIGVRSLMYRLPEDTSQMTLLAKVAELNQDPDVDAILVQLPLPAGLDERAVIDAIDPDKDVDGFSPVSVGRLWTNEPTVVASTPYGIMALLDAYDIDVAGQRVVIVGRSNIVGRPLAGLMVNHDATVTIAHSKTRNLKQLTREADILVVAVGRPHFIGADAVKPGATVIDVGISRGADGKLYGDVDDDTVAPIAGALTPVPGGVGPMTIASLMAQTVTLAKRRLHG